MMIAAAVERLPVAVERRLIADAGVPDLVTRNRHALAVYREVDAGTGGAARYRGVGRRRGSGGNVGGSEGGGRGQRRRGQRAFDEIDVPGKPDVGIGGLLEADDEAGQGGLRD